MRRPSDVRRLLSLLVVCFAALGAKSVDATPALTMDVATGEVLYQQDATQPWYPASTTKLMTVYVALSAVRDHQIAMNTPLVVSARAHKMPPSKMGFAVGTQVTLENALKMLMVRSANDVAITVAEGIGGSVEGFADDMNRAAAQLGMRESHFVNPNGLPASDHYSSVRDMAILARALYTEFPDQAGLFNVGELSLGAELIPNHNNLLGRYPRRRRHEDRLHPARPALTWWPAPSATGAASSPSSSARRRFRCGRRRSPRCSTAPSPTSIARAVRCSPSPPWVAGRRTCTFPSAPAPAGA